MTQGNGDVLIDKRKVNVVALDAMEQVHQHEIDMLNTLHELLSGLDEDDAIPAGLESLLQEVVDHTQSHFANEERLMQEYGFPAFPMHQLEHQRFLSLLDIEIQHWRLEHNVARLRDFLREYWRDWFFQHVSTMDRVTAAFIANQLNVQGLTG